MAAGTPAYVSLRGPMATGRHWERGVLNAACQAGVLVHSSPSDIHAGAIRLSDAFACEPASVLGSTSAAPLPAREQGGGSFRDGLRLVAGEHVRTGRACHNARDNEPASHMEVSLIRQRRARRRPAEGNCKPQTTVMVTTGGRRHIPATASAFAQ